MPNTNMPLPHERKLQAYTLELLTRIAALEEAATAVIARWDSPQWKELEPTGTVINGLRHALLNTVERNAETLSTLPLVNKDCWCSTCRPVTFSDMRMVLCPRCGNKRCPKAAHHINACTNSNEIGQTH